MRRKLPAAASLACACLAIGCGASDEATTGADSAKADYVAQVNEICATQSAETEQAVAEELAAAEKKGLSRVESAAAAVEASLPIARRSIEQASSLPRPAGDEQELDEFFSELEATVPAFEELVEALREGDQDRLVELNEEFTADAGQSRAFAERYGLDDCIPEDPVAAGAAS